MQGYGLLVHEKFGVMNQLRNAWFNSTQLSCSFRQAWLGISPLERLWKGFESDAELFMYRT